MSGALSISSLSTEYVHVVITVVDLTNPVDVSTSTAELAFPFGAANPADGDWVPALLSGSSPRLVAKVLIGPRSSLVLAGGRTYGVWLRLTDSPEQPVYQAGTLSVA